MNISEFLRQRTKHRAACRTVADQIITHIIKEIETIEHDKQIQILNMVQSELQIATRKE